MFQNSSNRLITRQLVRHFHVQLIWYNFIIFLSLKEIYILKKFFAEYFKENEESFELKI